MQNGLLDSSYTVVQPSPVTSLNQISFASTPPNQGSGYPTRNNVPPLPGNGADLPEVVLVDSGVDCSLGSASGFLSGTVGFDRFRHLCQPLTIWVSPGALDLLCGPTEEPVRVIDLGKMYPAVKGPDVLKSAPQRPVLDRASSEINIATPQRQYEERRGSPKRERRPQQQLPHQHQSQWRGWRPAGSPRPRELDVRKMYDNTAGVDKVRIEDILRAGKPQLRTCCSLDLDDTEDSALDASQEKEPNNVSRNAMKVRRHNREPLSARPRGGARVDPPVSSAGAHRFQGRNRASGGSRSRGASESPLRQVSAPGQEAGLQSLDSSTRRSPARPVTEDDEPPAHPMYLGSLQRLGSPQRLVSAPEGQLKEAPSFGLIRAPSPLSSYSFVGQGTSVMASHPQVGTGLLSTVPLGSATPLAGNGSPGNLTPQSGSIPTSGPPPSGILKNAFQMPGSAQSPASGVPCVQQFQPGMHQAMNPRVPMQSAPQPPFAQAPQGPGSRSVSAERAVHTHSFAGGPSGMSRQSSKSSLAAGSITGWRHS